MKSNKYLNLVSYFGGKYPHLKWLIDKFPAGNYHFVDMMCGSANVALNVNYPLVTINDLNDEVVNLFRVLRDNKMYKEFKRIIYFTPFSRSELNSIILDNINHLNFDPVEKARRFYTKCQLGFGANGSQNDHYGTGFEYKIQKTNYYRVDNWNIRLEKLDIIVDKLRQMQIEHRDSLLLFDKINKEGNIAYFDPPYVLDTRKSKKRYRHEVEDDFHIKLHDKIKDAKCFVAISGYNSPLYDELFKGMYKTLDVEKKANIGKILKSECLWTNYNPEIVNGTMKINFSIYNQ